MASATEPICLLVLLLLGLSPLTSTEDPVPAAWPHQFHSEQFVNKSGTLWKVDLWYDWPNGRNLNIIQYQLGDLLYDLEWNNGTSFYYTLEPFEKTCRVMHFDVGILRPNWLDGAKYLGQEYVDNFLCNVWEKVDFLWYYEDVLTQRPVKWIFFDGMITHVMTFEVGAVLEDAYWQAPVYCFSEAESEAEKNGSSHLLETAVHVGSHGTLMREREPIMQVLDPFKADKRSQCVRSNQLVNGYKGSWICCKARWKCRVRTAIAALPVIN